MKLNKLLCSEVTELNCLSFSVVTLDDPRAEGSLGGRGLSPQTPGDGQPAGGAGLPGVLGPGSGASPGEGGHHSQR